MPDQPDPTEPHLTDHLAGPTRSPESSGALRSDSRGHDASSSVRLPYFLAMIGSGSVLLPLNSAMLGLALPRIMDDFGISLSAAAWLMTVYLITISAMQPIGGRLGDMLGHQRLFILGMIGFALFSIFCALAPNFPALMVGRVLQGVAGSAILPNGFTLLRYRAAAESRGRAFGMIGGINATAAALGPSLGGILVAYFNWQAIFYANVAIIAVGLGIAVLFVGKAPTPRNEETRFDNLGSFLLVLFSVGLTMSISVRGAGSLRVWLAALAVVSFLMFLWHENRTVAPFVRLSLFRARNFVVATFVSAFLNLSIFGYFFLNPLVLQQVMGYSPAKAGVLLLSFSGIIAFVAPLGGILSDRYGRRLIPIIGLGFFMLAGVLYLGLQARSSMLYFQACLIITGIGYGLVFTVLQTAAMESSPPEHSGVATGVYLMARYIGGAVGISIVSGAAAQAAAGQLMPAFHAAIVLLTLFIIPALGLTFLLRPHFDLTRWSAIDSKK